MQHKSVRLHPISTITALLLLALLAPVSGSGQEKPTAAAGREPQAQSGEDMGTLELSKAVERELKGGVSHVYGLSLAAEQFMRVVVEQRGVDVVVALIGPGGEKLVEVDSPNGTQGPETVLAVTKASGSYRLEVRSPEKAAAPGRYAVTLTELRAATAADIALLTELEEAAQLNDRASKLSSAGRYKEAIPLAERVLLIKEKAFGPEHIDVANASSDLAKLYQAQGDYARAETTYLRTLKIREKLLGTEHPLVAATLNNLGSLYTLKSDYARAEGYYQRALAIREKILGTSDSRVATSLSNLAMLYEMKGDYPRSESMYQRAIAIYQKALGPEHLFVGIALNNLAELYKAMGDNVRAEPLLLRALEIREKALGPEHPDVAESLSNLAQLYMVKKETARAEPLYLRALAILEKTLGPEHPKVGIVLSNLALLCDVKGDYPRAEALYGRALAIGEKALGPEHPEVATTLNNFADLYREKRDYARAEPMYLRALAIKEKVLGPEHPLVADTLHNLAALHTEMGDIAQAVRLLTRRDDIRERSLALLFTIGSEDQKRRYLQKVSSETDGTVSLHVRYAPSDTQAAHLALTTVLRRKGRVLDAMAGSFGALRRRLSPQDRQVLEQLASVYSQYATLADKGLGSAAPAERRAAAAQLRADIEQLEALASSRSAEFRAQTQPVTLERVQEALPAGAALVELTLFRPLDVKAKTEAERYGRAHYVAYVLRREGSPTWADLGEVDIIDREVTKLRRALNDQQLTDLLTLKQVARTLDEKLMLPVRRMLGPTRRVFLSPDGALNLLPFGALVDERGKYLIEDYSFTYLTSGRDLLRLQVAEGGVRAPVAVADPAFDSAETNDDAPAHPEDSTRGRRAAGLRDDTPLPPLPATRAEVEEIKTLLPETRVLLGAEATEAALKQVSRPRILHVATHGFFLESEPDATNVENPLLRSGLFLAGANRRQSGAGEDGVLTALEVTGMDLWGTRLVVLSACDTGVGDVSHGEGVYGLRRALVLAGVESQVLTLWQVQDKRARDLMIDFYKRLQNGEGRTEALRQAQLAMLRGKSALGRHPFFWAGFIQSGDWRAINGK